MSVTRPSQAYLKPMTIAETMNLSHRSPSSHTVMLDGPSRAKVLASFDAIVAFEYGSKGATGSGHAQWLTWVRDGQIDRLLSTDALDAGAIAPTNLTYPRLVDIIDGGNDEPFKDRFDAAFNSFYQSYDTSVALQLAAVAALPIMVNSKEKHQAVWRWKNYEKAIETWGIDLLYDTKGNPL